MSYHPHLTSVRHDLVNDPAEKVNLFGQREDEARRLMDYLGYFSYTKLPRAQIGNVQEAYEWAHTAMQ